MKAFLIILLALFIDAWFEAHAETKHLHSYMFTTGNRCLNMDPYQVINTTFDIPKAPIIEFTSIKSGFRPNHFLFDNPAPVGSQLVISLQNETENYYYQQYTSPFLSSTKEHFDLPVHAFHNIRLNFKCINMSNTTSDMRGWVFLYGWSYDK